MNAKERITNDLEKLTQKELLELGIDGNLYEYIEENRRDIAENY